MKRAFHERYRAATTADGAPARVLVKVGAYHAFRGATPTHVQGLGGFVSELAIAEDAQALTILLVCGPGSAIRTDEGELPCSEWFAKTWGALEPQVEREAFTMFDFRTWRTRPRVWAHLPDSLRRQIDSFDLMVVAVDARAATRLEDE